MKLYRFRIVGKGLLKNLISLAGLGAFLSSCGALWVILEIVSYFSDAPTVAFLKDRVWEFCALSFAWAIFKRWPITRVACRLRGRDVTIEIAIGDLFKFKEGALIIGSNTTFDTRISNQLISATSIQGAFTQKYYDGDSLRLDAELAPSLAALACSPLAGKRVGKTDLYPPGTVVKLSPSSRTAYFVALADINESGVASSTFQAVQFALAELWVEVASKGTKEPLVAPVLGTGFSRITEPREDVIREMVTSFVAACTESVFADKLTIVLSPADVVKHKIDLRELGSFLEYVCVYSRHATPRSLSGRAES